jgi:hypothetical protein
MNWRASLLLLLGAAALSCGGCGGIGPRTVQADRFDYTDALATSWKQQMLVNMVRLRYGDAPVFLEVASIINQYSLDMQANANFTWVHPYLSIGDAQSVGATAHYIDRPTITYTPLSGEKFARSLMKPIPPTALLSLIEAGYPIDLVLRTCVHSINGIRNRYGGSARARPADPDFYPLLGRLRRMQNSGVLGLRVQKSNDKEMEGVIMTFRSKVPPDIAQESAAARRTLGLDPDAQEFHVAYGSIPANDKEIAILSRSILEIIVDLGSEIDVPAQDVNDRRVSPAMAPETADGKDVPALIHVLSAAGRSDPANSFVAVPYRRHWYWIDDRDVRSKTLFTFLMFIFSLTETQGQEGAPIVTIPAG